MRRENADTYSTVIARLDRATSIPETPMIESRSRGVLDTRMRGGRQQSVERHSHHVIARSTCDEAIHTSTSRSMDCFATLAMTKTVAHSRDPLARNDAARAEPTSPTPRSPHRPPASAWPTALPRTGCCLPRSRRTRIVARPRAGRGGRTWRPLRDDA